MQCHSEYHFIKKGFVESINENNYICYSKKNAPIDQIIIRKENDKYHFSFPMENSPFNYKTTFTDINKLNKYIKKYI
jgi:hypothetical protein